MFRKVIIGIAILYLISILAVSVLTFLSTRAGLQDTMIERYKEHFRSVSYHVEALFEDIRSDLETLAANKTVRTRDDAGFTSFLNADEKTFQYNYNETELAIIELFHTYVVCHPYVNSVYMGRANGSFVRSHPRAAPTRYDPRERPWYLAAIQTEGEPALVDAYPSISSADINIACAVALLGPDGQAFGAVGMDVTLNRLSEEMSEAELTFGGRMEAVDARGVIIVSQDTNRLNTVLSDDADYASETVYGDIRMSKSDGMYRLTSPLTYLGGTLVAYVPTRIIERMSLDMVSFRLLTSAAILLIVALCSVLLVDRHITRPIRTMEEELRLSTRSGRPGKMDAEVYGELAEFQREYNQLVDRLASDEREIARAKQLTISSLTALSLIRDNETGLHLVRTAKYVEMIATAYNSYRGRIEIPPHKIELMVQCAPMHDIGKVAIPDEILRKPGSLTPEEYAVMKKHPAYGRETLEMGDTGIADQEFMDTAVNMVFCHHEKWDGTGYPTGLMGKDIPVEARIMSIADAYDAITTDRVYKSARSHDEAIRTLRNDAGTHFDPELIEAFMRVETDIRKISELYRET